MLASLHGWAMEVATLSVTLLHAFTTVGIVILLIKILRFVALRVMVKSGMESATLSVTH